MKRKMLSTKNSTSWPWSRKCSATVRPVRPTRARAPGRLVHLAVDEGALGALAAALLVDAGLDHLVVEVVALAGALADAGEHRVAAVRLGDVVDQLHDQHGLADAGAAEQADLAALGVGREQVDDLDAGDEDLRLGRLLGVGRAPPGGWRAGASAGIGPASSTGSPMTFMMRPSVPAPTGTWIGCAGVGDVLAAHEALGGVHGDAAHGGLAELLGDFEHEAVAAGSWSPARSGSRAGGRRTARRRRRR